MNQKLLIFIIFLLTFQHTFSQVEVIESDTIEYVEVESEIPPEPRKKPIERPKIYHYYQEFSRDNNQITLKSTTFNKTDHTIDAETTETFEWKKTPTDLQIIAYKDGFELNIPTGKYRYKPSTIKNYVVYKVKKKYGVILDKTLIPAMYDAVGEPLLVKGIHPTILVAKRTKRQFKWGIIDAEGNTILPTEFDEIIIPVPTDIDKKIDYKNPQRGVITQYDGLYQTQKIITRNGDKYGLYNVNGKQILPTEYDDIQHNVSLDFYTFEKDKKFGFLLAVRNGISRTDYAHRFDSKDYILPSQLDEPIFKHNYNSYYFLHSDGTKTYMTRKQLTELLDEKVEFSW